MALASQGADTPHLPPISVIDDYLPNRTWQPPRPVTTPSPPLSGLPYQLQQSSAFSTHLPHTTFSEPTPSSASVNPDVAQVIHHCQHLCESIAHHKDTWPEEEDSKPWLDDMIGRANEVLNALLRLRKHQPRVRRRTMTPGAVTAYYCPQALSSSSSTPASSSSAYPPSPASSIHRLRQHQRQRRGVKKTTTFQGRCHSCNISETPEWRRGPDGARTLCNACGLHYAKLTRKKAAAAAAAAAAATPATQHQQPQHRR